jgi:hypothetical protein
MHGQLAREFCHAGVACMPKFTWSVGRVSLLVDQLYVRDVH